MRLRDFRLTRFQFARDRVIGDSQVRIAQAHVMAIELIADTGEVGLGFGGSLFHPLPALTEIERVFREEVWPRLEGQPPAGLVHRVGRPRGGNRRAASLPFEEGVGQACWDLAAKQAGLPLFRLLGGTDPTVRVYASGLDYHLSDAEFLAFFREAARQGHRGFKIKVGHPDVEWDLRRLDLLKQATGGVGPYMADSNEAWSPKEALRRLDIYRREGFDLLWIEDPILRDDFAGLAELRAGAPWVHVNSGEYLDLRGKRLLLEARGADMLNVHGAISDVMRAGWLAAEHGIPVTLGNTMLELGGGTAGSAVARILVPEPRPSRRVALRDSRRPHPRAGTPGSRPGAVGRGAPRPFGPPCAPARRTSAGAAFEPDQARLT
jgi:L-alanine-DL-glutamate epimerase-like enolase superfamily enzyme